MVFPDRFFQEVLSFFQSGGVEDGADVSGDRDTHGDLGDVGLGVLLKVELATLPRTGGKDGGEGGFEAFVGVAGNGFGEGKAAFFEAEEEVTPVDFGFGERDGDTEDGAFPIGGAHSYRDEDGAAPDDVIITDVFIHGVDDEVGDFGDGAGAPSVDLFVELFGGFANLVRRDLEAAEFFHDFGDAASGDTLEIHFGDGGSEGFFATLAAFKGSRKEGFGALANLRDSQINGADAGAERAVFKAVGVAVALFGALVGGGSEVAFAFDEHGLIDEDGEGLREAIESVVEDCIEGVFG